MDVTTITQLIGSLGFPIVCCGALFWYMIKEKKRTKQRWKNFVKASKQIRRQLITCVRI